MIEAKTHIEMLGSPQLRGAADDLVTVALLTNPQDEPDNKISEMMAVFAEAVRAELNVSIDQYRPPRRRR